jgi:hypothetical protein
MRTTIKFAGPVFYAQGDERAFFSWLKSIRSVEQIVGSGWNLELTMVASKLPRDDFKELFAVFERYRIDKNLLWPLLPRQAKWAQVWLKDFRKASWRNSARALKTSHPKTR